MATPLEVLPGAREEEDAMALGAALLRCRRLSIKATSVNNGAEVEQFYILPFFAGIAALVACGGLLYLLNGGEPPEKGEHLSPPLNFLLLATVVVGIPLTIAASFWHLFHRPRRATLTLHEGGFRCGKRLVRFDDLERLRRGRPLNTFQRRGAKSIEGGKTPLLFTLMGRHGRELRNSIEIGLERANATLQVEYADGRLAYLSNFLASYGPEDLTAFFGLIRERHPHLLG